MVKKWPLEKCAEFANAIGAMAATKVGATKGVSTMKETLKFMEGYKRGKDEKNMQDFNNCNVYDILCL